ncbi:MAG: murein biosynthesis integral membrane protein MurJ [Clostridium chrysemydis]|uniref:murein biosynthesis integral membrane protein MurJ n=1 Tax=Clostridium chrysemydis TaxID=2665504 RepID=UPI003F399C76
MNKNKGFFKVGFFLMFFTLLSKATGFFREQLLALKFGTSYKADAYVVATTIPLVIFTCLIIAVTTCFIPVYNKVKLEEGEEEALKFTNNVITVLTIFSILSTIFILVFTKPLVRIIASGFTGEVLELSIDLVRIMSFMTVFISLSLIYASYLQSNEKYAITAANNIISNLLVMGGFMFSNVIGIKGIAIVAMVGASTQALIQYPSMKKLKYRYKFIFNLKDKRFRYMMRLVLPVLIGTAVVQINTLIDRTLASGLKVGSVSALNYSNKLNLFVFSVVSVAITTVIFPKLSKLSASNETKKFEELSFNSLNLIGVITIPILVFVMFFAEDIVVCLFGYKNFGDSAINMTTSALLCYSVGMIFMGYRDVLNKIFYSTGNTKTPMYNSIIATVINIVLNLILVRFMGHNGLALASSISLIITTLILIYNLKNIFNNFKIIDIAKNMSKLLIISLVMGIFAIGLKLLFSNILGFKSASLRGMNLGFTFNFLYMGMLFISCVIVYIGLCYIFKVKEIREIIILLKERGNS